MPRKTAKKSPLLHDKRAPKRVKLKVNGKQITIKQKAAHDKGRFDAEMREGYLSLIREGFTNKDAAAACGAGTKYFKRRRDLDPAFEQAYQEARADGDDVIRGEIKRRGVDGVKRAIYHDGKVVGHKQEYSDQLLMFLAKARMPDEFGDKQTVNHNHKLDGAAEGLVTKLAGLLGMEVPEKKPQLIDYDAEDAEIIE